MSKYQPVSQESNSNFGFFFLILYTAAILIRPQEWSENGFDFPIIRAFLIIAFIFYVLQQKPKLWEAQAWCLLGLTFIIVLSGIRNSWFMGGVNEATLFITSSFIPFILFSSLINDLKALQKMMLVILLSNLFILHHGYSQVISIDGIGWSGEALSQGTRITYLGFFNDPNDLGMLFIMCLPFAFYFSKQSKSIVVRIFYYFLLAALFWGILKTNSRGALVGLLFMFGLYLVLRYGKVKSILVFMVTLPLVFVMMSQFREIDSDEGSAQGRIEAWYAAVEMFKYRPLLGVGKGNFIEHHLRTGHNSYAMAMAELGALGYCLWFVFIFFTARKLYLLMNDKLAIKPNMQDKWQEEQKKYRLLASTFLYAILGYASTAFFLSRTYLVLLFVFVGLACALVHITEKCYIDIDAQKAIDKKLLTSTILLSLISLVGLWFVIKLLL